ncbi:MAG TPA: GGDEF domain-containing protein [Paraburkholderia sp.]|jgi:diguanylate cyclase (GGDEF)-like protein|nr:GGDEF domain-containing protein [Paraburkholderia sp.]
MQLKQPMQRGDSPAPLHVPSLPPTAKPVSPRFGRAALAIGCLFVLLIAALIRHAWGLYSDANDAVAAFGAYRDTLVAMEKVSVERGPMNAALGDAHTITNGPPAPLQAARDNTDAAFARLARALDLRECAWCVADQLVVQHLQSDLAAARANVDRLLRLPPDQRTGEALSDVVAQMVTISRQFAPLIDASQLAAGDQTHRALPALQMARFAAVLRDEAGLLGSRFTSALAAGRALTLEEQLNVERSYGYVRQLRLSIESLAATDPTLTRGRFLQVNEEYFTHGIAYVAAIRALRGSPAEPLPTTAEFAAQYVPMMRPIIAFRDEMLDRAQAILLHQRAMTLLRCIAISAAGVVIASLSLLVFWLFRRYVVTPFTDATHAVIAISRDDLSVSVPAYQYYRGEVRSLFDALDVLRARSHERIGLERERDALIEQLTTMADTDPLTGLLNRRGFEHRARVLRTVTPEPSTGDWFVTLVAFDLDHFKRVNDTYGHPTGDYTLKIIGDLCRETWRRDDIVARTGGEEFSVLLLTKDYAEALRTVERFRTKMQQTPLHAADGSVFTMTASFGVVVTRHDAMPPIETMLAKGDALLYRAKTEGRDRVVAETPETPRTPETA